MPNKPRVLVIDDGIEYARIVAERTTEFDLVRSKGTDEGRVPDGPSAIRFLEKNAGAVDVVLLDMKFDVADELLLPLDPPASPRRTKRFQGVAILREIRARWPDLPVVLLTAVEDLSLVDAGGGLASQPLTYILDGADVDALRIRLAAACRESALAVEEADILWGEDAAMRALRRRLAVLARGRVPVILEGETGTGKSFIAERFIHTNSGRPGPFVTADLSTVPHDLVASYLFGSVKGAYTGAVADRRGVFELAHGGTLLIDEIQNVPPEAQRQLLLVLQDGRVRPLGSSKVRDVNVKVIAASNSSLQQAVAEGRFRQDLYMRLSPATRVEIPPLRERAGDLPFLAARFADRVFAEPDIVDLRAQLASAVGLNESAPARIALGKTDAGDDALTLHVPAVAWRLMKAHRWPGNVRELEMVVRNIVTFTLIDAVDALRSGVALSSPRLQVNAGLVGELLAASENLGTVARPGDDDGAIRVMLTPGKSLSAVSSDVERQYFVKLFRETKGDFAEMARLLLGDPDKARAVRLRLNQLGLKVRDLR
ncbi:MAG: sigma 54-interacting transcriptional regulator [Deltaproteobacteria bacterium]|nr:sigma 54-interacting transcriptional regulator [Deltaproteobacteria bacterium]